MKDNFLKIWVAITAILMALPVAMAAPGGGSIQGTAQNQGSYPGTTAGTIGITSGYVYLANVSGEQSTYHWAGIYGNATGTLILGDSSSNKMYEWSANATYILFSEGSSITWSSLTAATCTDVGNSFSFVGDSTGASDSCSNTFTTTGNVNFKSIPTVSGAAMAQTYDGSSTAYWKTYALKDGTNIIFAGEVDNSYTNAAYDGTAANYQVILPENGENGDTSATTYYIWIELY